ncbi:hypothetical protein HDU91_000303, partial [Kappamyces sp. JEL0680]
MLTLFLLSTLALAQECVPNFEPCLEAQAQFLEATCNPFQAKNVTSYNQSFCYNPPNCPLTNGTIQNERASLQTTITALCGA